MGYPVRRELDGVYFRVEREGRWQNVCFSDMTPKEREEAMEGRGEEWLRSMCVILADALRSVGDDMGLAERGE